MKTYRAFALLEFIIFFTLVFSSSLSSKATVVLPSDLEAMGSEVDPVSGLPMEVKTKKRGHILRLVPAGKFTMGSEKGDIDERPVHDVLKPAYYLGKYPVNNLQYEEAVPSHKSNRGAYTPGDLHPVTQVNWSEAASFPIWLGKEEGKANLYAMPSEAAWEKASQGGLKSPIYPWGNELTTEFKSSYALKTAMNYNQGPPNPLGFFHMTGNVFCWCWDWYEKDYYEKSPEASPFGPGTGKTRSVRGGTWFIYSKSLRCADRWNTFPETISPYIGIRIGRRLDDVTFN